MTQGGLSDVASYPKPAFPVGFGYLIFSVGFFEDSDVTSLSTVFTAFALLCLLIWFGCRNHVATLAS